MTSNGAQQYNIAAIRQLLLAAFTPEELRRFCYDRSNFRPVVGRFGPRHSLEDMADDLITYCDTRILFPNLLAEVQQLNPAQYARFEPDLLITEPKKTPAEIPAPPTPAKAPVTSGPVHQSDRSEYLDFELEIGVGRGRDYPVAVLHSPAGEWRATMWFPYDELALQNRLLTLQNALLRSGGKSRHTLSPEEQTVQDFGRELFEALFTPDVRSRYELSLREAAHQGKGLRLKLRIQSPKLAALPWEYLYHPGQAEYLCLSTVTPVVRYLEVPQHIQPLAVTPPLRILGMTASPSGLPELDIGREKQRIEVAIHDLRARGLVELTWLPGQSWRDLQRAMRQGPWHIFHFIGHGGFDPGRDEGLVVFADREGRAVRFDATRLGRLLADHRCLRLALLNSCEGARGSELDTFSSTAAVLVRRGIPAVLAMQWGITDAAAIEFARSFYEALCDGIPVDGAVAEARKALSFSVTNSVEWGVPVLYMRSPDGVLFQVAEAPEVVEPSPSLSEEREGQLEQLYVAGLGAFWDERWDESIGHFQAILDAVPEYRNTVSMLAQAQCRRRLDTLYAQAQAAQQTGDWSSAVSALEKLVTEASDFKDAATVLKTAKQQERLADLYTQARELHQAQQWQPVVNVFAEIVALDPDYPDSDDLLPTAEQEVAERQRQAKMDELYNRALLELDSGRWLEAQPFLVQLQEMEPGFHGSDRLLARVETEIEQHERGAKIAMLYEQVTEHTAAGQWRPALSTMDEIHALDPDFPDPRGLAARAQAELAGKEAEAQHQKRLAALYAEAVRLLRAKQYQETLDKWDEVRTLDPDYPDAKKVEATAHRKLAARDRPALWHRVPRSVIYAVGALAVATICMVLGALWATGTLFGGRPTDTALPPVATATETPTMEPSPTGDTGLTPLPTVSATRTVDSAGPTATLAPTPMGQPDPASAATLSLPTVALPTHAATNIVTSTRPIDGALMVYVPAGEFLMGSTEDDPDAVDNEKPQHTVYLDAFWIDKYEVTNALYRKCVKAGACKEPGCWDAGNVSYPDQPVVCVSWSDARDYADWAGGRLPTEAEWEKAARGTDGGIYPWGDSPPDCSKASYEDCADKPLPVGSHPDGASPYGALDMAGNVVEWVADWYDRDYYSQSPYRSPSGPERGTDRVVRGGSLIDSQANGRCAFHYWFIPSYWDGYLGFRVVVAPVPSGL